MIEILTAIFLPAGGPGETIPYGILRCLETLPHSRTLLIDQAPRDFTDNLAARGHTVIVPPAGAPPRMLWMIAQWLLSLRHPPATIATIEQDVAVFPDAFERAAELAAAAPAAVAALALTIHDLTDEDDVTPISIDATAKTASLSEQIAPTRMVTWQATFWATAALLRCNLFHAPPLDGSDIIVSARLRAQGYSLFRFTHIHANHFTRWSTQDFRENRFFRRMPACA